MGGEGLIMKRVAIALLTGAALVGLNQIASAADMAVKALPPPPPLPTWTGFYVGVHGGAAWQHSGTWSWVDPNFVAGQAGAVPSPLAIGNSSPNLGAVGGIQAGYNWQFWQTFVLGVEGDISWTSLSDHRTQSPAIIFGAAGVGAPGLGAGVGGTSLQMTKNDQWIASARAKFGYTGWFNNTLLYVTGGGAWVNVDYTGTGIFLNGFSDNVTFNTTKSGWVAGAGAEWQATTNILLRAEYLYYNFDHTASGVAPYTPAFGNFGSPVYSWDKFSVQVFRVAASYKF